MKFMLRKFLYISFISCFLISGCSSEEDKTTSEQSNKEHFLKDQVRALEKAKGVEQMLQSGADKRQQEIEEQTRRQ